MVAIRAVFTRPEIWTPFKHFLDSSTKAICRLLHCFCLGGIRNAATFHFSYPFYQFSSFFQLSIWISSYFRLYSSLRGPAIFRLATVISVTNHHPEKRLEQTRLHPSTFWKASPSNLNILLQLPNFVSFPHRCTWRGVSDLTQQDCVAYMEVYIWPLWPSKSLYSSWHTFSVSHWRKHQSSNFQLNWGQISTNLRLHWRGKRHFFPTPEGKTGASFLFTIITQARWYLGGGFNCSRLLHLHVTTSKIQLQAKHLILIIKQKSNTNRNVVCF